MVKEDSKTSSAGRFVQLLSPLLRSILVPLLAVFTAVIVGGFVIAWAGGNPFRAFSGLLEGAFGSTKAWSETAVWATPYILAGSRRSSWF